MIRLDLGSGGKKKWRVKGENVKRLDIVPFKGVDIVVDIREKGIPLKDNSCEYIETSHFLEHFTKQEFIKILNECWRVLCAGGLMYVIVPHRDRPDVAGWPIHLLEPTENTFTFFEKIENDENIYKIKKWKIKNIVVNERQDIHVKMIPEKNGEEVMTDDKQ